MRRAWARTSRRILNGGFTPIPGLPANPLGQVGRQQKQERDVEKAQVAQFARDAKQDIQRKVDEGCNLRVALNRPRQETPPGIRWS